jgi:hypothetical protein
MSRRSRLSTNFLFDRTKELQAAVARDLPEWYRVPQELPEELVGLVARLSDQREQNQ